MNRIKKNKGQTFGEFIKRIEDPNSTYPWVAKDLPENPSSLEKAKYELCQKILGYQEENNLSDEILAQKLELSQEQTLQILFGWIDNFTLDSLITYANKLFSPSQIQIILRQTPKPKSSHVRTV